MKWVALALAVAGVAILSLVATAAIHGGALLTVAVAAAIFVLLLPVAAYFIFRTKRAAGG
jgi:hypothetical protein